MEFNFEAPDKAVEVQELVKMLHAFEERSARRVKADAHPPQRDDHAKDYADHAFPRRRSTNVAVDKRSKTRGELGGPEGLLIGLAEELR